MNIRYHKVWFHCFAAIHSPLHFFSPKTISVAELSHYEVRVSLHSHHCSNSLIGKENKKRDETNSLNCYSGLWLSYFNLFWRKNGFSLKLCVCSLAETQPVGLCLPFDVLLNQNTAIKTMRLHLAPFLNNKPRAVLQQFFFDEPPIFSSPS